MTAIVIDRASNGARAVSEALDCYRVSPQRLANTRHRVAVNWGVGNVFRSRPNQRVLNDPAAVRGAIDKVAAFNSVGDLAPPNWQDINSVNRVGKDIILCRRNFLSEGKGITVVRPGEALVQADFYVKYVAKHREYRLHVFNGTVIAIQRKIKRNGVEQNADQTLIRNHDNGWVFSVNNLDLNDDLREQLSNVATQATARLRLDFAAIDLIVGRDDGRVYFLEANTRPGIESATVLNAYANAIRQLR